MILLKILGFIPHDARLDQIELDEKKLASIQRELIDAAEMLARSNVTVSTQEYIEMFPEERAAMITAGNSLRDEMAIKVGRCVLDPNYQAELEAPYDGGAMKLEVEFTMSLHALSGRMEEVGRDMRKYTYIRQ